MSGRIPYRPCVRSCGMPNELFWLFDTCLRPDRPCRQSIIMPVILHLTHRGCLIRASVPQTVPTEHHNASNTPPLTPCRPSAVSLQVTCGDQSKWPMKHAELTVRALRTTHRHVVHRRSEATPLHGAVHVPQTTTHSPMPESTKKGS